MLLLQATALLAAAASNSVAAAADVAAAAAITETPMRGWVTWERYTCETDCVRFPETCISEHLIRTTADAMEAEGLVAAGYNYIQVSGRVDDRCRRRTASAPAPANRQHSAVSRSTTAGPRRSA